MVDSLSRALRDGVAEGEYAPALMLRQSSPFAGNSVVFAHLLRSHARAVSSVSAQPKGILLLGTDRHPYCYRDLLDQKAKESISWFQVLDCYTDPLGWEKWATLNVDAKDEKGGNLSDQSQSSTICYYSTFSDIRNIELLMARVLELGQAMVSNECKSRFSVVIDSISTLLRHNSLQAVAGFLSALRSHGQISSILFVLHSDLHDERTINALEYISTMIAYVEPVMGLRFNGDELGREGHAPNNSNNHQSHEMLGTLKVRHKRRNGRVWQQVEEFQVEASGIKWISASKRELPVGRRIIPQLQFNLQLTEKEREDRAKVVLPFEHQGDGREVHIYDGRKELKSSAPLDPFIPEQSRTHKGTIDGNTTSSTRVGEIHYLRDSDDERPDSDEDPDDDLDI